MYPFYASNSSFVLFIVVCSVLLREGTFFSSFMAVYSFSVAKGYVKKPLNVFFSCCEIVRIFYFLLVRVFVQGLNRCLSFLNFVMFVCPFHAVKGCGLFIYFLSECSFLCPEKIHIFSYFCFIQIV